MTHGLSLLGLTVLVPLVFAGPVLAHRLDVIARIEDDLLVVEALYGEDSPAPDASVVVRAADAGDGEGEPLFRGKTDARGRCILRPARLTSLRIDVDDRHGHRREIVVPAAKLSPLFDAVPRTSIGSSGPRTTVLVDTREERLLDRWPRWVKITLAIILIAVISTVAKLLIARRKSR